MRDKVYVVGVGMTRYQKPGSHDRDYPDFAQEAGQKAPMIFDPMTTLQCCPTSDGGAAAILANADFVKQHGLEERAVEIAGISLATDTEKSFDGSSMARIGYDMSVRAARAAFEQSGHGPEDIDVVELHD